MGVGDPNYFTRIKAGHLELARNADGGIWVGLDGWKDGYEVGSRRRREKEKEGKERSIIFIPIIGEGVYLETNRSSEESHSLRYKSQVARGLDSI